MTRQSTKQRGVTLVEVTLTLAISTLLVTTILAGRNSVRSTAQFSDGIERIKETILSAKSRANTSNNTNKGAGGTGYINQGINRYLNFGQSIRFIPNSSSIQTLGILCYANSDLLCSDKLNEDGGTSAVTTLPWGIKFKSYSVNGVEQPSSQLSIIFARNDKDGSFTGYWLAGRVSNGTLKSTTLTKSTPITLNFVSTDNRTAHIDVNPATGTVTRTIDQ